MNLKTFLKGKMALISSIALLSLMAISYTHCGKNARLFIPSDAELSALDRTPFDSNDNITGVGGVDACDEDDLICKKYCLETSDDYDEAHPACLGDSNLPNEHGGFCLSCDYSKYEDEKIAALAEVEASKSNYNDLKTFCEATQEMSSADASAELLNLDQDLQNLYANEASSDCQQIYKVIRIPVRYAISSGKPHDYISHMAYSRSILREDHTGYSYIMGGENCSSISGCGVTYSQMRNANSPYYKVNHNPSRQSYINGEKRYFSTVSIIDHQDRATGAVGNGGVPDFPGFSFWIWPRHQMYAQGRLHDKVENLNTAQIVPLYVADFRKGMLQGDFPDLLRGVGQYTRSKEYMVSASKLFNLPNIWNNFSAISENLCRQRTDLPAFKATVINQATGNEVVGGRGKGPFSYAPYEGCNQLIQNLFCSKGTVLPLMYTPLVVDLGEVNIRTSSIEWGSYFNFALAKNAKTGEYVDLPHRTSWLGGYLKEGAEGGPRTRAAQDGFLVVLKDGMVKDARQMFGTKMEVDGKTYADGFKTLQAYAKKDCKSTDPKERYVGPWDTDLYGGDKAINVWIDVDRDGVSKPEEIISLKDAGIAAINTCYVEHDQTYDKFKNKTELRSAFLYVKDEKGFFEKTDLEDEVLNRLLFGKSKSGESAKFRAVIDIYFNTRPKEFLEDIDFELSFEEKAAEAQPKNEEAPQLVRVLEILEGEEE